MKKLITVLFCALSSLASAADLDQGYEAISQKLDAFNEFLNDASLDAEAKRGGLSQVVQKMVDFGAVADRALGAYASKISDAQREQFERSFGQALAHWLVEDLMRIEDEFIELSEFTWLPDEQKAVVNTLGRKKLGFGVSAGYSQRSRSKFVLQQQDGEWKVVDLSVNSVNIAENFLTQIDGLMRKGKSFESVLERMQKLAGVE